MCSKLAKKYVDDPDVPAAPDGASGYAEWTQIAVILFRVELDKSLRETEYYLNEMLDILAVFNFDEAPHYNSVCRWSVPIGCGRYAACSPSLDVSIRGLAVVK